MTITLPPNSNRLIPITQTARIQWLGLWRAFRGMRKIHGERAALLILEVIL